MDFVFDRVASGRTLKCLVIVDDATHEAVAVLPERAAVGPTLMDGILSQRGKPTMIRTDNGADSTGKSMLTTDIGRSIVRLADRARQAEPERIR